MRNEHSQPAADLPTADWGNATSHPLSGSLFPTSSRPQVGELQPGNDAHLPPSPTVGELHAAARLAVAEHRAAADECSEAESLWRAALGGGHWQESEGRYTAALRRVTATRHRALVSLGRLAAADVAEFRRLCATSELDVAGSADGPTVRITDRMCDDRSKRSLTGLVAVGLWHEIDGSDR